jgi:hypothetical protein
LGMRASQSIRNRIRIRNGNPSRTLRPAIMLNQLHAMLATHQDNAQCTTKKSQSRTSSEGRGPERPRTPVERDSDRHATLSCHKHLTILTLRHGRSRGYRPELRMGTASRPLVATSDANMNAPRGGWNWDGTGVHGRHRSADMVWDGISSLSLSRCMCIGHWALFGMVTVSEMEIHRHKVITDILWKRRRAKTLRSPLTLTVVVSCLSWLFIVRSCPRIVGGHQGLWT